MCIILSNFKRGQTSMLISYTMKEALYELLFILYLETDSLAL